MTKKIDPHYIMGKLVGIHNNIPIDFVNVAIGEALDCIEKLNQKNIKLLSQINQLEAEKLEMAKGYIELAENSNYNHDIFLQAQKYIEEVE